MQVNFLPWQRAQVFMSSFALARLWASKKSVVWVAGLRFVPGT